MQDCFPDHLISAAQSGDAAALDRLVRHIQTRVFRLARRFLYDPDLAADATQEILIRVITKLGSFNGESRFETWVYRVAVNALLNARKAQNTMAFASFGEDLLDGLVDDTARAPEDHVMLNELRIHCTMAMMLCLAPPARMAYVLGDILELEQGEAAKILDISPAAYRKRLSRARAEVVEFTTRTCGLANAAAPCSCPRRLPAALKCGRLPDSPSPDLADAPSYTDVAARKSERQAAEQLVSALQRATGSLRPTRDVAAVAMRLVAPPD